MSTGEDLIARYTGQTVPVSYSAGFVILSYVVSLLGAGSTLVLINRRTSIKGAYNHFLLFGAALSFGGIGIWSMHYVANRSIILLNGELELQIAYSPGITIASFFLPIVVLLLAFLAVSTGDDVKWWRIGLSGLLSGGAVCFMHFLGNTSLSNYECDYNIANVVGAAVIAVSASTVALTLFFVFRAAWTASLLRMAGCTVVLAGAVFSMHWCAALGTQYRLLSSGAQPGSTDSRDTTVIIVICLAVAASFIMITAAVCSARTKRGYAIKAQQIALAAAVFDKNGRILVTPEGLLPSETITETFPQKMWHDDVFSTAHPLFHWMYRASRSWSGVSALLGWMASHVDHIAQGRRGRSTVKLMEDNGQLVDNYDIIFRELYCLAASALAARMSEDLINAGTLWGEIFHTGGIEPMVQTRRPGSRLSIDRGTVRPATADEADLLERGALGSRNDVYGRGSLLFLVRHVENPQDITKLEAAGYRFAETHRVADIISSSMQIKTRNFEPKLRAMASHAEDEALLEPGVHVGMFAVKPRLDGFNIMVDAATRSVLPTARLPLRKLEDWQLEVLRDLDGLPMQTLLIRLAMMQDGKTRDFAAQLRTAIANLRSELDDAALDKATLSARVVRPSCLRLDATGPTTCELITLQVVLDISTRVRCRRCDFIPLQFFKVKQLVTDNRPHQAAFSRELHREMSALLASLPSKDGKSRSSSTVDLTNEPGTPISPISPMSEDGLADAKSPRPLLFGGIMVSQEIAISVADAGQEKAGPLSRIRGRMAPAILGGRKITVMSEKPAASGDRSIEMGRVDTPTAGFHGGGFGQADIAAGGSVEAPTTTFVDELFSSCIERRS